MSTKVEIYHWNYKRPDEIPGVKITAEQDGRNPWVFIADDELYDVAVALADIIDRKNNV